MKDPAFVFYSSDFLTGVMDLTMEERGQYITLLCLQHQKGHLNEKTIKINLGQVSKDVLDKFKKDKEGNYYNERLEEEIEKRAKFKEHQKNNGKLGGAPKGNSNAKKQPKNNPNEIQKQSKNNPLEDEIDNEIINEVDIEKEVENVFAQYNEICTNLSQVSDLTDTRTKQVKNLLESRSKEKVLEVFVKANKSDWLTGKNENNWKANFDWIIEFDNFVRIEERTV